MAERLAPLTIPAPITSRPERTRRQRWRWPRRLVGAFVTLALLLCGAVATVHFLSIERHAHEIRATSLVPLGMPARVLVVLARPGQELPMAGTLLALQDAGTDVALLSLTSDATGSPADARSPVDLEPTGVLRASADLLGVDTVWIGGYAQGDLWLAEPSVVTQRIEKAIQDWDPSAIATVTDVTGSDHDSQVVAGYTIAAVSAPGSGVARVWTSTSGHWEHRWQARAGAVPRDHRVPEAQVAVRLLGSAGQAKGEVVAVYGAADEKLASSVYPGHEVFPASLYFRFWDREYFALAWGESWRRDPGA